MGRLRFFRCFLSHEDRLDVGCSFKIDMNFWLVGKEYQKP